MPNFSERLRSVVTRAREREQDPVFRERLADLEAEAEAAGRREQEILRLHGLRRARVPEATWPLLAAPEQTGALVAARAFIAEPSAAVRFLTLAGPKGRGKTFALAWSVAQCGGRFFEAQELVQLSTFDRLVWDDMAAAPLLALDELGAEQGNASFDANLYSVLNGRFRRNRKTILATNLAASDFRKRYLDRSGGLDRLEERLRTGGRWVPLPGDSMRRVGAP